MTWTRWLPLPLLLASWACEPNKEELIRLQREIAQIDSQVSTLQQSVDERTGDTAVLLRHTLDRLESVNRAAAAMDAALKERVRKQEESIGRQIAAMDAKADRLVLELHALRGTVADLSNRTGHLEQTLIEVEDSIRAMPRPPSVSEALGGPPAGVTAESLFQDAIRDQFDGRYDLALRKYRDYLKYFGNTELTASAQFHVGELAFHQGDLESALAALDRVIERYPKSGEAPDALYLKAKIIEELSGRSPAAEELNKLVRRYPNSDAARLARSDLNRSP